MKSAIIGLGVIGKVHYDVLKKQGEEIVALCDTDFEKLGEYEGVKKYFDYKVMLEHENIDVVHVCTPHYLHAEMVIYALKKGINVLCEKPLCISIEQLDTVLDAEKKYTAKLGVCFQNRYNNSSVFAKKYLEGKEIEYAFGSVRWHRDKAYYESADWRGKWNTEGGGVLINQAIHTLDLLQWIVGEPKSVVGGIFNRKLKDVIEVEDTACADFLGEHNFTLFATTSSPKDMPIELRFLTKNECVDITPDSVKINGKEVNLDVENKWYGKLSYGCGHEKLIRDFYESVSSGEKFLIDGAEGAKAVRQVLAVYRSDGKVVRI
ncbi:MAG: Gfo/Idh/MocA family oxidoreductase [Clostridia bacterium]|nr:Gfo/Idh/MocA family oxidoreductase [Clostridia bacterium]